MENSDRRMQFNALRATQMVKETIFGKGEKYIANCRQYIKYSETEVLELLKKSHFVEQNIEQWFEQNKKK
jgi:hypothetical protein